MKLKKIMPLFAISLGFVLAVSTSGFKSNSSANKNNLPSDVAWFKFTGDQTVLSQLQDHLMYSYIDGSPCSGEDLICAVRYSGIASSGQHPATFSPAFKSRIASVYNGGTDSDISQEDQ